MSDFRALARQALRAALQTRRLLSIRRESPLNIYDVATNLGLDVRFLDSPSLEGMYCRDPGPTILLPSFSNRPRGRIAFSCAHELGHHQLNHGTQVDKYLGTADTTDPPTPEERAADVFASTMLMPRQSVLSGFQRRGWRAHGSSPFELFVVACELGVGYQTLLYHMTQTLQITSREMFDARRRVAPKTIRSEFLGVDDARDLLVVDRHWCDVPIDLEVEDVLALPDVAVISTSQLVQVSALDGWVVFRARHPGTSAIRIDGRMITVRIARRGFTGPFKNRFLEDPDIP